jgi:hypothetical protein
LRRYSRALEYEIVYVSHIMTIQTHLALELVIETYLIGSMIKKPCHI